MRITQTPKEVEVDGVKLDHLPAGTVREVSSSIGAWLIAEGYAVLEMRRPSGGDVDLLFTAEPPKRRRRSNPGDRRRSHS